VYGKSPGHAEVHAQSQPYGHSPAPEKAPAHSVDLQHRTSTYSNYKSC